MSSLEDRISKLEGEVSKLSDRVGKLEERVGRLEDSVNALRERVARVEGIVEQMDKRLNHIETELREFRREVSDRFEGLRKEIFGEILSLRRELNMRFYWLIGILMTMWVTIILAIAFKAP
jgi:predicted  nucleic acid-binding Zn-ribbon protein